MSTEANNLRYFARKIKKLTFSGMMQRKKPPSKKINNSADWERYGALVAISTIPTLSKMGKLTV